MELPIDRLPEGRPQQLIVPLHGEGSDGVALAPLAQAPRSEFPQAAVLAPGASPPTTLHLFPREIHPVLVPSARSRLRHHIPARTWAAALGAVPEPWRRHDAEEDD